MSAKIQDLGTAHLHMMPQSTIPIFTTALRAAVGSSVVLFAIKIHIPLSISTNWILGSKK